MTPSRIPVPVSSHKRPTANLTKHKDGYSPHSTRPLVRARDVKRSTPPASTLLPKQNEARRHRYQQQQTQRPSILQTERHQRERGRQLVDANDSKTESPSSITSWRRVRSTSDSVVLRGSTADSTVSSIGLSSRGTLRPTTVVASPPFIKRKHSWRGRVRTPSTSDRTSLQTDGNDGQSQIQQTIPSPVTPIPGSCVFFDHIPDEATVAITHGSTDNLTERVMTPAAATIRMCQSTHVCVMLRKTPNGVPPLRSNDWGKEDFLNHYIDLLSYIKNRQERLRTFKRDIGQQNLSTQEVEKAWTTHCAEERKTLRLRRQRTLAIQFQILTQVGQGGFGEVFLARKTDTNELCALKRMSKKHLHFQDEVQHILTERDVLTATRSEWHVKLLYSFQDPDYVYLAMEFVQGGDVRTMLTARGVLREADAKLYFAEMVMAIDALHQQGYIHRDLKPENFLIDRTGHLKLTDFGLSKGQLAESRVEAMKARLRDVRNSMEPTLPVLRRGGSSMVMHHPHPYHGAKGGLENATKTMRLGGAGGSFANLNGILHRSPSHLLGNGSCSNLANNNGLNLHGSLGAHPDVTNTRPTREYKNEGIRRAFSIVGSADYMAPEILANKGYDFGVDYWSLGCILFEFLCGYSPFQAEDTRQTCVNVWHWRKVLRRPVYDTAENLEFNLTDEAWDLITCLIADRKDRYTTVQQMKDHPWLSGLDWSHLRSLPASFVPVLASTMDTSYFDDFSNPEDMLSYKDVMMRQEQEQEQEPETSDEPSKGSRGGIRQNGTAEGDRPRQDENNQSSVSSSTLPPILQVHDPWKGAFVGFTFRHRQCPDPLQSLEENARLRV